MKQKRNISLLLKVLLVILVMTAAGVSVRTETVSAAKKPTFVITPNSGQYGTNLKLRSPQKHSYLFQSYMEQLEKTGGGTLIVKKGKYNLPISVQVPSNVTIQFQDGVVINKTQPSGTKNSPLFQLISPSKYFKKNAVKNYNGTKNVKFIGTGKVVLNMHNLKNACAIIMAQNKNVEFRGITFKNGKGHFFELDASKNVTIENCKFINGSNDLKTAEAINLDTPDTKTGGFSFKWSKKDKKPNVNVTIKSCTFDNMNRAIGTHKYSQANGKNMMHTNITITGNTFHDIAGYEGAVVPYNWSNVTITNNTFKGKGTSRKTFAIVAHSVVSPEISGNTISGYANTILIRRGFKSSGYTAPQAISVTEQQKAMLSQNYFRAGTVTKSDAMITTKPYYTSNVYMDYYPLTRR